MNNGKRPVGRPVALGAGRRMSIALVLALAGTAVSGASALAQEKGPDKGKAQDRITPKGINVQTPPTGGPKGNPSTPKGGSVVKTSDLEKPAPELVVSADDVNLSAFSEPVQLSALVSMLADAQGINIAIKGDVPGTVVFNAPVTIKRAEFRSLVDALLEQQGYTIVDGVAGFVNVIPLAELPMSLKGEHPSTRVISTPNLRPSALTAAITSQLGGLPGNSAGGITYLDELGVIVVTGTQRKLDLVDSLVKQILAEYAKQDYLRIELTHVAAPVARQRALDLIGAGGGARPGSVPGQPVGQPAPAGSGAGLDNLGDRLTIDPQGNALIFKGVATEIDQIKRLMAIIDTSSQLQFKRYEVGGAAQQVADLARNRGLGEVTSIQATTPRNASGTRGVQTNQIVPQTSQQTTTLGGGPTMIVDDSRGQILYYATEDQHTLMASLIKELDIQAEEIVIRTYKIRHSKADEVAELILAVLRNESPAGGTSSLLPQGGQRSRTDRFGANNAGSGGNGTRQQNASGSPRTTGAAGGELSIEDSDAFVVADVKNNQIMVKAALKQQRDFERLIAKLDLRRPSVYIEATIVSVTWDDSMRLAFETQLINASGKGGLLQTNFGLATTGTTSTITDPKSISPGMSGFTAALLRSDYVPIAITALQNEADAKVLSKPQLLVDDNENAEIVSLQEQATASGSTSTGNTTLAGGFSGYVQAGTTLNVTPQIAGGGYLRLQYNVELSSFTGQGSVQGGVPLPPPKLTNTVTADSVTVPSDFTVVVGGLTVDSKTKTVVKVPFLGDLPLVGLLFQDRNTGEKKTTLYVFLTPRVVRDPADIRLLSVQPKLDVGLPPEGLDLKPTLMESSLPGSMKR